MIGLGVDVSTRCIAFAAINDDQTFRTHLAPVPVMRGARRLQAVRELTMDIARQPQFRADCAVIEIPWAGERSSFALLSCAGVVMEAIQAALPGAVVMDVTTGSWKKETVGWGNATKEQVMTHARSLGYVLASQDLADAVCMAVVAQDRWCAQVAA